MCGVYNDWVRNHQAINLPSANTHTYRACLFPIFQLPCKTHLTKYPIRTRSHIEQFAINWKESQSWNSNANWNKFEYYSVKIGEKWINFAGPLTHSVSFPNMMFHCILVDLILRKFISSSYSTIIFISGTEVKLGYNGSGKLTLCIDGILYHRSVVRKNRIYWHCPQYRTLGYVEWGNDIGNVTFETKLNPFLQLSRQSVICECRVLGRHEGPNNGKRS